MEGRKRKGAQQSALKDARSQTASHLFPSKNKQTNKKVHLNAGTQSFSVAERSENPVFKSGQADDPREFVGCCRKIPAASLKVRTGKAALLGL